MRLMQLEKEVVVEVVVDSRLSEWALSGDIFNLEVVELTFNMFCSILHF